MEWGNERTGAIMNHAKLPVICKECGVELVFDVPIKTEWDIVSRGMQKEWVLNEKGWFCPKCKNRKENISCFI